MSVKHIAHIVFRFDFGGLENGLVNLVNHLPAERYRHTIISLTTIGGIRNRINNPTTNVLAIGKCDGKDWGAYVRLFKILREIKPDVVHTRNIGTLDVQVLALLLRTQLRIHSEHGWDVDDPDGISRRARNIRKLFSRLVCKWVCVSAELEHWSVNVVGIPRAKVIRICNGVDIERFKNKKLDHYANKIVFGSVTRFSAIKNPLNTIRAFANVHSKSSGLSVELIMVGDGSLLPDAKELVNTLALQESVYFTGAMQDTSQVYQDFHVFVLASLREGISNTVLEAMSSGLPVIASRTGGNIELVENTKTGYLVEPGNTTDLAAAMMKFVDNPELIIQHGNVGREHAIAHFSITHMVDLYDDLYQTVAF